jgi:hypothetical protein
MAPRTSTEGIVVGFGLIGLGLLWMLSNMGRLDLLSAVRTWWPLLLVVWGALELMNTRARKRGGEVTK